GGWPRRPDASRRVPPAKAPMTGARFRGRPPATRRAKANEPRQSGAAARGFGRFPGGYLPAPAGVAGRTAFGAEGARPLPPGVGPGDRPGQALGLGAVYG